MSARYDVIHHIADYCKENGVEDVQLRHCTLAIMSDSEAEEAWRYKYGTKSPSGLSDRKSSLLLTDVEKVLSGEEIRGGSQGVGHRAAPTGRSNVKIQFVDTEGNPL